MTHVTPTLIRAWERISGKSLKEKKQRLVAGRGFEPLTFGL